MVRATFLRYLCQRLRDAYQDCYGRLAVRGGGRIHAQARIYRQEWCDISIGEGSLVDAFATLYCANSSNRPEAQNASISIGKRTFIGSYTDVRAGDGRIEIGDHSLIAQHVSIVASGHGLATGELIREQPPPDKRHVTIGSDVWVGAGARLLPGVTIGDHAVVAAGAVVTRDVPESAIVAGVPANVMRYRS